MCYMYKKSVVILRRDLRLDDNTALLAALEESEEVLICFIFDSRQKNHEYFSTPGFQFLCESLKDLSESCVHKKGKLCVFSGLPVDVLEDLKKTYSFQAVFTNKDYTPFSAIRDAEINKWCLSNNIAFMQYTDLLLQPNILKDDGTPYTVFTPYYKKSSQFPVSVPRSFDSVFSIANCTLYMGSIGEVLPSYKKIDSLYVHGGRKQAFALLENLSDLKDYDTTRNIPHLSTTGLSAHNKFGTVSIREVYFKIKQVLGPFHSLLRQLYWRDFFYMIAYNFPHVFGSAFQKQYETVWWDTDQKKFSRWCEGKTGFPIVDAGMRELNETGYMHNRVRMIVASFLTKDLHIDWRLGEKYFAKKLVDYDPCVNNGSWQWAASTGCDAQPYFRIFNPWLQQKKFDPNCEYIKKWVPELRDSLVSEIHDEHASHNDYPRPIVIHAKEKDVAIHRFAISKSNNNDT